jgi:UDP-N-acetylglucosamine 2-epimerase
MKILSVVGARPQFIKLAPMDKTVRDRGHEHVIVHTGQHYDYKMSEAFFDQLEIAEPDYNLEIGSGSHARQTAQMLEQLGEKLAVIEPDIVLIYGDTNSTLAGALAAVKLHIPVGHVEAGYRSGDMSMPEEVNRVVADRVSQILFAPTQDAIDNLAAEGVPAKRIFFAGNIMAEALLSNLDRIKQSDIVEQLGLEPRTYAVMTAHRPENTNDPDRLRAIIEGVAAADFPVIFPVHPRTRAYLEQYGLDRVIQSSRIRLVGPMKYIEFAKVQSEAKMILTDSGGIQEEALLLGVPCLTMRYNTERTMTIDMGANQLVGADAELIRSGIERLATAAPEHLAPPINWDTGVASRIITAIETTHLQLKIKPEVGPLSLSKHERHS